MDNDRTVSTNKMYPIDLAPQKITIVKSVSNTDVKMAHLLTGQAKTTGSGQIITNAGSMGIMRPTAQIISSGVTSQPQMIVSSPILQGAQIVSQSSQLIGPNTQIISQSQLMGSSGQLLSPGTQIISQGTQLSAQVSSSNNSGAPNVQSSIPSSLGTGSQVLNVGGLVSATGNIVVSTSVRPLPAGVRVLPQLSQNNSRPTVQLSTVNVSHTTSVVVNKSISSHVPRGLAAGASLAVRPMGPNSTSQMGGVQGGSWGSGSRTSRAALVYGARNVTPTPRASIPQSASASVVSVPSTAVGLVQATVAVTLNPASHPLTPHSTPVTLPTATVLTSSSVISNTMRGASPRPVTSTPARPLPLLQRNYPPKVVGVGPVGVRPPVGNSAPSQLYYEVPRASVPTASASAPPPTVARPSPASAEQRLNRPFSVVNAAQTLSTMPESRPTSVSHGAAAALQRPTILRKRELENSPAKIANVGPSQHTYRTDSMSGLVNTIGDAGAVISNANSSVVGTIGTMGTGWEDVPICQDGSGSTTVSASSSPAHDEEIESRLEPIDPAPTMLQSASHSVSTVMHPVHPVAQTMQTVPHQVQPVIHPVQPTMHVLQTVTQQTISDLSPRKKPRKQVLNNDVRKCDYPAPDEGPPTPPAVTVKSLPKRPQLSSSYVCGWRATHMHFVRPSDVRRRESRPKDILAIANQKNVIASADGWKVHHITAQMDDLMSLEADVGEKLEYLLRSVESSVRRTNSALKPHSHNLLELLKGNIQRSKIVWEGIQEAREEILQVFKHQNIVSDILSRQADKRCFRKHRIQS